ncbi:MAG: purine-nucleoside phosphorylase, partial [Deltaproteobacteria bacterium]|nr:purine-nucleoside phosphorylase [Deltaproteobacteria bacterium]
VRLDQGVYAAVMGPAYETPAETFMLRSAGADIVGMSTVPEILAAAQVGLPVGAIALISNRAAGLTDGPVTHAEVTDIANRAGDNLARLLEEACGRF